MPAKIFRSFLYCTVLLFLLVLVAHAAQAVKWDSLVRLDDLAERCAALSEAKDVFGLRKLIKPVTAAMATVAADPVPAGVKAPDQVKILQADLKSLTETLADPGIQSDDALVAILAAIHPVVEKVMEAAGMPHVHENDLPGDKPAQETRP